MTPQQLALPVAAKLPKRTELALAIDTITCRLRLAPTIELKMLWAARLVALRKQQAAQ